MPKKPEQYSAAPKPSGSTSEQDLPSPLRAADEPPKADARQPTQSAESKSASPWSSLETVLRKYLPNFELRGRIVCSTSDPDEFEAKLYRAVMERLAARGQKPPT